MINPPKTLIEESIVLSSSSLINKRLNNTHAILYRVGHRVTGWLAGSPGGGSTRMSSHLHMVTEQNRIRNS